MDAWLKKKQEREAQRKEQESKLEKELEAIRKERDLRDLRGKESKDKKPAGAEGGGHLDVGLEERRLERERLKKQLEEQRLKEEQDRYIYLLQIIPIPSDHTTISSSHGSFHLMMIKWWILRFISTYHYFSILFLHITAWICRLIEYIDLLLFSRERIKLEREKTEKEWQQKKKDEEERERKRKEKEESERKLGIERENERQKDIEKKKKEKEELERKLKEEREKDRQRQEAIDKLKKGIYIPSLSLWLGGNWLHAESQWSNRYTATGDIPTPKEKALTEIIQKLNSQIEKIQKDAQAHIFSSLLGFTLLWCRPQAKQNDDEKQQWLEKIESEMTRQRNESEHLKRSFEACILLCYFFIFIYC